MSASQVGGKKRVRAPLSKRLQASAFAKRLRARLGIRLRAQLETRHAAKRAKRLRAPLLKGLRAQRAEKEEQNKRETAKRKASVFAADARESECKADDAEQAVAEARSNLEVLLAGGAGDTEAASAKGVLDQALAQLQDRVGAKRRAVRASVQSEENARKLGALSCRSGPLGRLFDSTSKRAKISAVGSTVPAVSAENPDRPPFPF